MIEPKDIPKEYVNIRQVWLRQIDRCAEAISHRFIKNTQDQYTDRSGLETVVESVIALEALLVDFGEALILSDVKDWLKIKKEEKGDMNRFRFYRELFHFIVETLNKYGMLFESQPRGYSNVEMRSV
jgi:hypothetical protein